MSAIHKYARPLGVAMLVAAGPAAAQESQDANVFDAGISVTVENHHFNDVRVYAVSGARSWRLGNVVGLNSATFELPRFLMAASTPIRIVAYPIGTASVVSSEEVNVRPGDEVVYRVEARLPLSNLLVRTPS